MFFEGTKATRILKKLLYYFDIFRTKKCVFFFQSVNIHEVCFFDQYFLHILIILLYLGQMLIFFNVFGLILKRTYRSFA